jgi:hypothetical protein
LNESSESANPFAVHRQLRRPGRRNDFGEPLRLDLGQRIGGDRLDLRHHQMRPLRLNQRLDRFPIGHIDRMGAMRDLMARRVRIAVHRDHFHAKPLQCDDDFLAQLARAEQHDARGRRRERRADPLTNLHDVSRVRMKVVGKDGDVNMRRSAFRRAAATPTPAVRPIDARPARVSRRECVTLTPSPVQ